VIIVHFLASQAVLSTSPRLHQISGETRRRYKQ